jgi:hypothetical protein
MPAGLRSCYGVYLGEELAGAVVFTSGARNAHRLLDAAGPNDVATLARLWLSDRLPKNSESRVIGVILRILRRETTWKLLLSYADPAAGHNGTIYQATGWRYLGMSEPNTYVLLPDGKLIHPRTASDLFGSNSVVHLRATNLPVTRAQVCSKHRYVYLLDPAWRWRLRAPEFPYPNLHSQERAPPGT